MKNLEQLVMTRALVKEERKQGRWYQRAWVEDLVHDEKTGFKTITCGSTACVAGWAVVVDGGKFLDDENVLAVDADADIVEPSRYAYRRPDGTEVVVRSVSIERRAQRLLGLEKHEAAALFDGENSYQDVKRLLKQYIKEAREERRGVST
jgi:hypothetical protein